jgi:hypothetical protein
MEEADEGPLSGAWVDQQGRHVQFQPDTRPHTWMEYGAGPDYQLQRVPTSEIPYYQRQGFSIPQNGPSISYEELIDRLSRGEVFR